MSSEEEQQLFHQLIEDRDAIRNRVCIVGTAARWHIAKASKMVENPDWANGAVERGMSADALSAHLQLLPRTIEEIEHQDRRCAESWTRGCLDDDLTQYEMQRTRMIALFDQTRLGHAAYVRLVRQPEKPFVREATRLLAEGDPAHERVCELESKVRMTLKEYLQNEAAIDELLRSLDSTAARIAGSPQGLGR
ncbi:MAG TPA: hypothetical protein VL282_00090 [Tepidisphaeraceae bacterium]|jgi:hypothetical protein|nr:hypothetical protein [Tepidisphaeraceae bacterium]